LEEYDGLPGIMAALARVYPDLKQVDLGGRSVFIDRFREDGVAGYVKHVPVRTLVLF
jgi:hypothetical protein